MHIDGESDAEQELQWIDSQVGLIAGAIQSLAESCDLDMWGEAPEIAERAHQALTELQNRARALVCLSEVVDEAACHAEPRPACKLVAQMARRARYVTDLGHTRVADVE